jgi:prevent-host-death family protein
MPKVVSKSSLKSRMLEYLREVEATGEELIVTSHGRPVLKIVPYTPAQTPAQLFSDVRGRIRLPGDDELTSPIPADAFADSDLADLLS